MGPISGARVASPVGEHGSQGVCAPEMKAWRYTCSGPVMKLARNPGSGEREARPTPTREAHALRGRREDCTQLPILAKPLSTILLSSSMGHAAQPHGVVWLEDLRGSTSQDVRYPSPFQGARCNSGAPTITVALPISPLPHRAVSLLSEPCRPNGSGILYVVEKGKISRRPFRERHRAG